MNEGTRVGAQVVDHLVRHRALLTRRWLRAVSQYMRIRPFNREAAAGLINQLPSLFAELCSVLAGDPPEIVSKRALDDARAHASVRWRQGFALDELFLELDLLQRCIKISVREYFVDAPSREGQTEIYECIEAFFGDAIRGAVAQFSAQQDRRVNDALNDRDHALASQRRSEERLRMAAEAAGLGIFEWDPSTGAAVWENERMFEITGQPRERGALSATAFFATAILAEDMARLQTLLDAGRTSPADVHVVVGIRKVQSGAHCIVEISGRFMDEATGLRRVLVGTMADVTSRVRAEDALREADRRKDAFLATLAHELRNPLAPILNAAHLLHRRELSAQQLAWIQGMVERHANHLAHLIDDLLDLSRISTGKIRLRKEIFDVRTAIERAIEMNAPAAAERGHRLEVTGMPEPPAFVRGDLTRITQVLSNLLDNANKYTREGGHIQIDVRSANGQVCVAVTDDGIGMDPATIPTLFEMFEQAPESGRGARSGLGIGLSVARSLIAMHGGTIEACSEGPDKGSCFTISLPACDTPADGPGEGWPPGEASVPSPRRLLIVDDNHDAATSLAQILDSHDVRVAGTAAQALALARDFQPEMVFLDLGLPDMSGLEVAARLLAQSIAHRPVLVALTGYGQPEDREQTRAAGFDHHLVKPASVEEILRLIARSGKQDGDATGLDTGMPRGLH
ncbi:hybrid sensor histidine kinase/response regulator [Paraburkholderia lycopersici]|uniref:histidine kinase n=1 Tax=Paraburkholderia lycopersici TaxID=416944 RepID=A0A1G6SKA0_9BURK|nr:ATP-binding protein [Paraburkholderia lycopersici]SDD17104.1 PAS domain S-box-containing protein [Paraburkholderia lycopersici]